MKPAAATELARHSIASLQSFLLAAAKGAHRHSGFFHLLSRFGLLGLFLVSIVDSSFVPLPVPGVTDIMLIVFAAQKINWVLLLAITTVGSALGGYFSYQVGHAGGMQFLEKHVPGRIFNRVCDWMEHHAILAVALPAVLPPPMPLSPFVLAAGVLKMSKKKFLSVFTVSRCARHALAIWLGIRYGSHVLHLWNRFSDKWATTALIILWTAIAIGCAFGFWNLYKTSKTVRSKSASLADHPNTTA